MTESEIRVFEHAFAIEWMRDREFLRHHSKDPYALPEPFSCAEVAESCMLAFRAALTGENAPYLEAHGVVSVTVSGGYDD